MNIDKVLETIETDFKGKAADEFGSCQYLTNDGKKCYIGLFIPDGHKGQDCPLDALGLLKEYPDLRQYLPTNDVEKLRKLQIEHDNMDITKLDVDEQKMYLQFATLMVLGDDNDN